MTQLSVVEAERVVRAGAEALGRGRFEEAQTHFERVAQSGRANVQIWLMLAHCCARRGDGAGAEKAADEVLARDERNIRGLIIKGDARAAAGDDRGAASFIRTALKLADQLEGLPADLGAEVERARAVAEALGARFRSQLETHLEASGSVEASARFRRSIEILTEEKPVYFQQPTAYFFPELPQIQFYEAADFPWAAAVEASTDEIRAELEAALASEAPFKPYLQARADRPKYDFHGLLDNPAWSTLYLWENGGPVAGNAERFPGTFEALREVPLPHITARAPSILFSLLKPGARIAPHTGMVNTRLICHLPLIVPQGCGFRCGNEVREWVPGKLLIFDDTIEHEAWNDSGEDRIILIFDVWRPELSREEQAGVSALFAAIDSYESDPAAAS